jgi:hypothetical protein
MSRSSILHFAITILNPSFMKAVLFVLIILFCSCKTEEKVSLPSTDIEIYNDIASKNPHLTHEEIEDIMFKGE